MKTTSKFYILHSERISIVISLIILTVSCTDDVKETNSTVNLGNHEIIIDPSKEVNWRNPVLIQGSSFVEIINSFYRIGDFDKLYYFTDKKSKTLYTKQELKRKWKELPLGMDLRLLNSTEDDSLQWLHYETTINATKYVLRTPVVIENDSCRIVFDEFCKSLSNINSLSKP